MKDYKRLLSILIAITSVVHMSGCCTRLTKTRDLGKMSFVVRLSTNNQLYCELKNTGEQPVVIEPDVMPWMWQYSMWLKVYVKDLMGTPLDEAYGIQDLPPKRLTKELLPGNSVHGYIDMEHRIPDLKDKLRYSDLILFWSYIPRVAGAESGYWFHGALKIPKSK